MIPLKVAHSPYGVDLWRRWLRKFNMKPVDGECKLCDEPFGDRKILRLHPQYPEEWGHQDCVFDKTKQLELLKILDDLVEKFRQETRARKPL